jgi:hypothetical protein
MPYPAPSSRSRKLEMRMFGGVPISVTSPPRIDPNARGMRAIAGAYPSRYA